MHQDIKPSNVLIDEQGTPLLTDFNIAVLVDERSSFSVGGTLNYMSPEQLRTFCIDQSDPDAGADVRSDIYSLGIVLLELLTGSKTWGNSTGTTKETAARELLATRLKSGPPSIAGSRGIDHSLSAIIAHALQPDPQDRYQTAAEFATDLTRWLENRSNVHAENPNHFERGKRFARRNIFAIAISLCVAAVSSVGFVTVLSHEWSRLTESEAVLDAVELALLEKQTSRAAEELGRAKASVSQLSLAPLFYAERNRVLTERINQCSEQLTLQEANRFAALFGQANLETMHRREHTDGSDLIEDSLRAYRVLSHANWQSQRPFVDLPEGRQREVAENITELLLNSMVTSARARRPSEREWDSVIARLPKEHQSLAVFSTIQSSGDGSRHDPASMTIANDFEAYLYGVAATASNNHAFASRWYTKAIELRPTGQPPRFWLHYRHGLTYQQLARPAEALLQYAMCTGMRPDFAWTHFNLGLASLEAQQFELAITHLQHAIRLDPHFASAYIALGALYLRHENYEAAITIYDNAIAQGLGSSEVQAKRALASKMFFEQINN